eukprot:882970-Alexandrium_andersonii.AAC.1
MQRVEPTKPRTLPASGVVLPSRELREHEDREAAGPSNRGDEQEGREGGEAFLAPCRQGVAVDDGLRLGKLRAHRGLPTAPPAGSSQQVEDGLRQLEPKAARRGNWMMTAAAGLLS